MSGSLPISPIENIDVFKPEKVTGCIEALKVKESPTAFAPATFPCSNAVAHNPVTIPSNSAMAQKCSFFRQQLFHS